MQTPISDVAQWRPREWVPDANKDRLLLMVDAAYREVHREKMKRLGMWSLAMQSIGTAIQEAQQRQGYEMPPLYWAAFLDRLAPPAPMNQVQHMRLLRACMTDCTQLVQDHIRYRVRNDGNVHFVFSGATGSGKSSCAVALADWMHSIPRGELKRYVNFDVGELPTRLKDKKRGEAVVQDEYLQTAGEGSRTAAMFWENVFDTLRASGVSIFVCTPGGHEHATMQAVMEAIAWNPTTQHTLMLVHVNGIPLGVTAMPWMAEDLYAEYKPWKLRNVERTLSGQFRDSSWYARMAVRLFRDPRIVNFLSEGKEKPKKSDVKAALMVYSGTMMAGAQSDTLVDWIYTILYGWDRLGPRFEEDFGIEPSEGLREVGNKCSKP